MTLHLWVRGVAVSLMQAGWRFNAELLEGWELRRKYFLSLFLRWATLRKDRLEAGKMSERPHAAPTGADINNRKVIAAVIIHGSPLVCADYTNREQDAGPRSWPTQVSHQQRKFRADTKELRNATPIWQLGGGGGWQQKWHLQSSGAGLEATSPFSGQTYLFLLSTEKAKAVAPGSAKCWLASFWDVPKKLHNNQWRYGQNVCDVWKVENMVNFYKEKSRKIIWTRIRMFYISQSCKLQRTGDIQITFCIMQVQSPLLDEAFTFSSGALKRVELTQWLPRLL